MPANESDFRAPDFEVSPGMHHTGLVTSLCMCYFNQTYTFGKKTTITHHKAGRHGKID